jgi:hypothetical protein
MGNMARRVRVFPQRASFLGSMIAHDSPKN